MVRMPPTPAITSSAGLVLGRGIRVGHNAVAMLQRAGIAGRSGARKRYGIPSVVGVDDLCLSAIDVDEGAVRLTMLASTAGSGSESGRDVGSPGVVGAHARA
jgi:hypothetical protein